MFYQGSRDEPGPDGGVPPPAVPVMLKLAYWKVVYDNPNPNSYRGAIFAWSKCL